MDEMQLDLGLHRHMPIRRYALFKDFRGVLYCEPVDEMLQVYERPYPARPAKRDWRGRVVRPAREAGVETEIVFDPKLCNRLDYFKTTKFSADELSGLGWRRSSTRCYMQENYWGMVQAIMFIEDLERGERMQKALWALTPEGYGVGQGPRDNKAKPRFEARIVEDLDRLVA